MCRKGVFHPKPHWEYDGNNRCGRQNRNAWANSKAIMDAGITNNTADPAGGRINRNEDGTASGFFEDCVSVGVTSVREAGISDEPAYEAYLRMLDEDLPINLFMDVVIPSNHETSNREKLKAAQQKIEMFNRGNYYTGGVKIFLDGVCEAKTGAVEEPYSDDPNNRGTLLWEPEDFNEICRLADEQGLQIHIHAIGDRAVCTALDGMEYASAVNGSRDARNMIAHIQLMKEQDLERFASLGAIPVMTPQWFEKERMYREVDVAYLGCERADSEYLFRRFFDAGVLATCGSDAPIGVTKELLPIPFSPWQGIQQAITRCAPDASYEDEAHILNPSEKVDLKTAIKAYTIYAAASWFREKSTGSLLPGKDADLILLDRDLFHTEVGQIYKTVVKLTMKQGKIVYRG